MKKDARRIEKDFRSMFQNVRRERALVVAEGAAPHLLGKCAIVLSRDKTGFYIEARQNMGWTDFDAVKEALLPVASKHGLALDTPGPDGISQPVLRLKMPASPDVKSAWKRLSAALSAMDEILRRQG